MASKMNWDGRNRITIVTELSLINRSRGRPQASPRDYQSRKDIREQ